MSRRALTQRSYSASRSSTQIDIQVPLSAVSSPSGPKVNVLGPRPRPPWPSRHRKISDPADSTEPNPGPAAEASGFHSNPLRQPSFSNQAKLSPMSETFRLG